MRIPDINN